MTSDTTINTGFQRTFTFTTSNPTSINRPVNGMIKGTISDGTNTGNMICISDLGAYEYNSLFCAGQEPNANNLPYNLLLIQTPTQSLANLRANWDAEFNPQSGTTWTDSTANELACTLNTGAAFTGDGTASSPFAVNFNSTNSGADFGASVMSSQTKMMFDTWIAPASANTGGKVVVGNSNNANGNGFTLRQSLSQTGKMELVVGKTYQDVALSFSPVGYWRLGEASGTVAYDISGNANNGAYAGTYTQSVSGGLTNDASKAVTLDGSTGEVDIPWSSNYPTGSSAGSMFGWIKYPVAGGQAIFFAYGDGGYTGGLRALYYYNGGLYFGGQADDCGISTPTISDGNWHHVGFTYASGATAVTVYFDGVGTYCSLDSGVVLNTPAETVKVGTVNGYLHFQGSIQDFSMYGSALNSTQVSALYNAGLGTYGGICYSASTFSNNVWNFLGGLYDGTNASLIVNGRQECQVAALSAYFTSPATDLFGGSTASGGSSWQGEMAQLEIYGTSDGSSVGTTSNLKSNFDASADNFRAIPEGNIVTNGLVFNLDPANAARGLSFPGSGCSATSGFDLSPLGLATTLMGFSNCGTYGWQGSGTVASPYQIVFDGSSSIVDIAYHPNIDSSTVLTLSAWFQSTASSGFEVLVNTGSSANGGAMYLGEGYLNCDASQNDAGGPLVADGNWHFATCAWDSGNSYVYVDGVNVAYHADNLSVQTQDNTLGAICDATGAQSCSYLFSGSLGSAMIHNLTLSATEISQNCKAQQSRYSSSPICH